MMYVVPAPGEVPRTAIQCFADDAEKYKSLELDDGSKVAVRLCFAAHTASDGRRLIPYEVKTHSVRFPDGTVIDGIPEGMTRAELVVHLRKMGFSPETLIGNSLASDLAEQAAAPRKFRNYLMNSKFSPEVTTYLDSEEAKFVLPESDVETAKESVRVAKREVFKNSAIAAAIGLLVGWLLMVAVGWVVRGFMGIPRGMDMRSE